jgi:hypothetical protein
LQFGADPVDGSGMDLTAAAIGFKQAQIASRVQYAVAGKVLDSQKMEGAAALKLLSAASSGVAKAGDAMVAAATGLGGAVDTYA